MEDVRRYFDRVAPEWDNMRQGFFTEEVRDEVLRRVQPRPEMRVVDVGCGTGFLAEGLAGLVAQVHCVDTSARMLEQAREHLASHRNVSFHLCVGTDLPMAEDSVEAVVACMYLHHVSDPPEALREMARILRPGGRLVLADLDEHGEEWMRAEMADVWLGFSRPTIREWMEKAGLEEVGVECCGQNCCADRPEGGRAAISIFIAEGKKGTRSIP